MAFSDKAIGFYLQADEKMLVASLGRAEKAYDRFVGSLEKLNRKAFATASNGMGNMASVVASLEKLTSGAEQRVNVRLSKRSEKSFSDAIEKAVLAAMMRVQLRLRASMPKGRLKMFSDQGSLRMQYRDMPQPPDMLGGFMKFKKGGEVPGEGNEDSVLAALTPGEVVLPKDLVGNIKALVADLRRVEGTKNILQAGLGSKAEQKDYTDTTKLLGKNLREIVKQGRELSAVQRGQLSQVLGIIDERMESLASSTDEASGELKQLGSLGKTGKFIGLVTAVESIQNGIRGVAGLTQQAFQVAGGEGVRSFIDNLRDLRVKIGLTGDQYGRFAEKMTSSSKLANVALTQSTAAADALFEAGVRGADNIANQAIVVAQAAKLTRGDLGDLASTSFLLTDKLKFQQETLAALYGDTVALSRNLAVDAPGIVKNIATITSSTKTLLQDVGPDAAAGILQTFQRISAASSDIWADQGDQLNMVFANALSGSDQALKQLNFLTDGIISTPEELVKRLEKGDVANLFQGIGERLGKLDQRALARTAEAIQLDPNLLKVLAKNTGDFEARLAKTAGLVTPIDKTSGSVQKLAGMIDEVTTGTEKLQKGFQNLIGQSPLFIETIEFLDQIPVSAALSTFWIGKSLFGAFGKLLGSLRLLGPLLGFGGAAAAAGGVAEGAAAAAGGGGLLGGLKSVASWGVNAATSVGKFAASFVAANPLLIAGAAAAASVAYAIKKVTDEYAVHEENMKALEADAKVTNGLGASISNDQRDLNKLLRINNRSESQNKRIEELQTRIDEAKATIKQQHQQKSTVAQVTPPTVTKTDIDSVVAAASAAQMTDTTPMVDELQEQNRLMKQMLQVMMEQNRTAAAAGNNQPNPVTTAQPRSGSDGFIRTVTDFQM